VKNEYEVRGDITAIFLKYKGEVLETLINTSQLNKVKEFYRGYTIIAQYKAEVGSHYAAGRVRREDKTTYAYLHRVIKNFPDKLKVDHWDNNTLNNTDDNLRIVTNAQNMQNRKGRNSNNTSGIRGVSFNKEKQKWKAQLEVNGVQKHIGYFLYEKDAKEAIEKARIEHHPYSIKQEEL